MGLMGVVNISNGFSQSAGVQGHPALLKDSVTPHFSAIQAHLPKKGEAPYVYFEECVSRAQDGSTFTVILGMTDAVYQAVKAREPEFERFYKTPEAGNRPFINHVLKEMGAVPLDIFEQGEYRAAIESRDSHGNLTDRKFCRDGKYHDPAPGIGAVQMFRKGQLFWEESWDKGQYEGMMPVSDSVQSLPSMPYFSIQRGAVNDGVYEGQAMQQAAQSFGQLQAQ